MGTHLSPLSNIFMTAFLSHHHYHHFRLNDAAPTKYFLWKPIPRQIHLSKFLCAGAAMRTFLGQKGMLNVDNESAFRGCCWYNDNVISLIKLNLNRKIFLQNTQKSDPFPHASISSEIILLCHPTTKRRFELNVYPRLPTNFPQLLRD